jgi:hypothetical protein
MRREARVGQSEPQRNPKNRSYSMTSQESTFADQGGRALPSEPDSDRDSEPPDEPVTERTPPDLSLEPGGSDAHPDGSIVEELATRLPTSELVKIIKGALECGRRNLPFTESDLLRAMTFGSSSLPARKPAGGTGAPRR